MESLDLDAQQLWARLGFDVLWFCSCSFPKRRLSGNIPLPRGTVQIPDIIRSTGDVRRSHSCSQLTLPCCGFGGSEVM